MPAQSGSFRGPSATGRYTYRATAPARPQTATKGERAKLTHADLHPSGLPRSAHLDALKAKSAELDTAGEHRERIEDRREALIVMALRSRACDDIELASLTGLTPDHIRKATRRIRRPA